MKFILKGNALYGQGGGPTSVINSSAYGVIKEAKKHSDIIEKIYAMHYGIEGLLDEDIIDISNYSDVELEKLKNTPGAAFGSNRYKLPNISDGDKTFEKIISIFKKYNIRYFFYNGGNDSMDTINKICEYAKLIDYELFAIGIPKTIDNDLALLDHAIGYPSAAKFIANAVSEIYIDDHSYQNGRVNIVEIMGRNAGWLTASSLMCKLNGTAPDLIYVPEAPFNLNDFLNSVKQIYNNKHHCLVCLSEGIKDENGNLVFEASKQKDKFGHEQLGGVAVQLSHLITAKFGFKTRSFELSLLQRANAMLPSTIDLNEAIEVGTIAVKEALNGQTKKIITINRDSLSKKYKPVFSLVDIDMVANKEKLLPKEYINQSGNYINDSFLNYLLPLVEDNESNRFKDGLLDIFKLHN